MKKQLTLTPMILCLMFINLQAQQQQLSNSSFENWQIKNQFGTDYADPVGWQTLNALTGFGYSPTTTATTDAYSGDSAVLLETKAGPFSDLPGILSVNKILNENLEPDLERNYIPFTSKPAQVQFYFKGFPAENDSNAMLIHLTKWVNGKREIVAEASWTNGDTVSTYTKTDIPFNYFSNETPDSMQLIFSSSIDGFSPQVGSKIYLDDFEFVYEEQTSLPYIKKSAVKLYPNPANNIFVAELPDGAAQIEVFDITGKRMFFSEMNEHSVTIDCSNWRAGIYQVIVKEMSGNIVREKIIVNN